MKTKILALINEGLTTYAHIASRLGKTQELIAWYIKKDPELSAAYAINRAKVTAAKDARNSEIAERLRNGESIHSIAREYKMCRHTVYEIATDMKINVSQKRSKEFNPFNHFKMHFG